MIARYEGMGFRSAVAKEAAAAVAAGDTVVRRWNRWEAAEPSAVHPRGLRAVARDCSDIAIAAAQLAVVPELVAKPANSGNSARVVAVLVLVTRTDSSFQSAAQRSLIVVGTLFVEGAQWLIFAVVRPVPPMGPMSFSLAAVSSQLKYH